MAIYSILSFKPNYYSTVTIPVAVALWGKGYVGFFGVPEGDKWRGVEDEKGLTLIRLTIEKIESWLASKKIPHDQVGLDPTTTEWWEHACNVLVHSLVLSKPAAIDLPATPEGLQKLSELTLNPYRVPAIVPPNASTDLFAELSPEGYRHIYPSEMQIEMCSPKGPVHPVVARQDAEGDFYGWWDAERQYFTMIWPSEVQLRICFPYGPEAEERRGRGRVCRLSVTRREPV